MRRVSRVLVAPCLAVVLGACSAPVEARVAMSAPETIPASTPAPPPLPATLVPHDWLLLAAVDGRSRRPIRPEATFAKYVLDPRSEEHTSELQSQ